MLKIIRIKNDKMKELIMKENKFIGQFLCIASAILIIFVEFITEKLTISKYLDKERNGIVNYIILSIFMMIFAVPMVIFMRYLKIE